MKTLVEKNFEAQDLTQKVLNMIRPKIVQKLIAEEDYPEEALTVSDFLMPVLQYCVEVYLETGYLINEEMALTCLIETLEKVEKNKRAKTCFKLIRS